MTTIKEKLFESSVFLEEYAPQKTLTKEERDNSFLDDILKFQKDIEGQTAYYEKGIKLIQKLSWVDGEGEYDQEVINEIILLKKTTEKVIKLGLKEYVLLHAKFQKYASKQIKNLKDSLDEFKETSEDVFDKLLDTRTDSEFLKLEERIKNL